MLNSVKERGSNGALRSHLFAKGRTRRGGSRRSFSGGAPGSGATSQVLDNASY